VSIEDEIEKLKAEYKLKQQACDKLILASENRIRLLRKTKQSKTSERKDWAILQAQRQAYVQAECDIDSLLDHLIT
jgi:hypothetical protein